MTITENTEKLYRLISDHKHMNIGTLNSKTELHSPKLLRYPGGKGRLLKTLSSYLPHSNRIKGTYIEPFLGGASIFFHIYPRAAILSDINSDLIDLYITLRDCPDMVWQKYCEMPMNKEGYYQTRSLQPSKLSAPARAARLLYLNRTCFKGMWRQNKQGQFNIGYGGESRRWVITDKELFEVSSRLRTATIICSDFESIIKNARQTDFIFLDPPYRPSERDLINAHYFGLGFTFDDQKRLANSLITASLNKVPWVMTNSAHPDICALYEFECNIRPFIGTGSMPGLLSKTEGEVIIFNEYAIDLFS